MEFGDTNIHLTKRWEALAILTPSLNSISFDNGGSMAFD